MRYGWWCRSVWYFRKGCRKDMVASADDKKHLRDIMLKPRDETTDNDIKLVLDIYKKYNAIKYAQDYAEDLIKQSYNTIDEIPVENKTVFKEIASFMANRMS